MTQLDEAARADLAEQKDCPRCKVPPGSPCRTRTGTVATVYHSVRYDLVPQLRSGPPVRVPKDREPGKAWRLGPAVDEAAAPVDRPGDRIGYARVSTRGQDLDTQERLLRDAGCIEPLYVETISTRQPDRPRFAAALAALRPNDILTVTMLDRLGRNTLELITSAQDIEHRGNRLEILQGPLAGIYDPRGAGKIVFATFAAFAEAEREFIRDRTLDGLETATAKGRFGGRPRAVDDDVLAVAQSRLRRPEPQSITAIARDLGVGRSTLYRALAHADDEATRHDSPNA